MKTPDRLRPETANKRRSQARQVRSAVRKGVISRRAYVGFVGIGTLCTFAGCIEQVEQTLDEFEDAAVSEEIYRNRDSFEFDAADGDDIFIDVRVVDEGDSRGRLWLTDPNGTEVIDDRIRLSTDTRETHTADADGTYLVGLDPGDARLQLTVSVTAAEE